MTDEKKGGQSALAALTAEVMQGKKTEARKLTPVAGEAGAAELPLPNDVGVFMSNEALHNHAKALRKFAVDAIAIADGIDVMVSGTYLGDSTDDKVVDLDAERKAREAEGDAKAFARDFEAKQKAAQEATFKHPDAEDHLLHPTAAEPPVTDWVCPDHGKPGIGKTSKAGRPYIGCPDCNKFER